MIVSIDGSSGAGKGTLARGLCDTYHFDHIDSGLLYRKVAYYSLKPEMLTNGVNDILQILDHVVLDADISESELRAEQVAQKASEIAIFQGVRNYINEYMIQYVEDHKNQYNGFVIDGRDIGSVVFPDADVKLFLQASEEDRTSRRMQQNQDLKTTCTKQVDLKNRDQRDSTRKVAPLVIPDGAVVIDTSSLSIEQTLEKAREVIDQIVRK